MYHENFSHYNVFKRLHEHLKKIFLKKQAILIVQPHCTEEGRSHMADQGSSPSPGSLKENAECACTSPGPWQDRDLEEKGTAVWPACWVVLSSLQLPQTLCHWRRKRWGKNTKTIVMLKTYFNLVKLWHGQDSGMTAAAAVCSYFEYSRIVP